MEYLDEPIFVSAIKNSHMSFWSILDVLLLTAMNQKVCKKFEHLYKVDFMQTI
jgi:hypothetical protein